MEVPWQKYGTGPPPHPLLIGEEVGKHDFAMQIMQVLIVVDVSL